MSYEIPIESLSSTNLTMNNRSLRTFDFLSAIGGFQTLQRVCLHEVHESTAPPVAEHDRCWLLLRCYELHPAVPLAS
eukprot:3607087-Amphidinium_carterae.1